MLQLSDSDLVRTDGAEGTGQPLGRLRATCPASRSTRPWRWPPSCAPPTGSRPSTTSARTPPTAAQAEATRDAYVDLLEALAEADLAAYGAAEVSVKLSAVGQALPQDGDADRPRERPRHLPRPPRNAGTTVTLDMEDHTTTDSTLEILRELRKDFP